MSKSVIIYGKDTCGYTSDARQNYASKGYVVDYRNVKENPADLEEMLKLSNNQRLVPVIVEDGKAAIGFGGT